MPNDILIDGEKTIEDVLDSMAASQTPQQKQAGYSLVDLENNIFEFFATLPKINRAAMRLEMENMVVPVRENPTTADINEGLAKAQGYKERLSEIYNFALRDFRLRKRGIDMLFDAINLVSKASSADKRKGEATMRYPMYLMQLEASETFVKMVEQVLNNVKSASDAISRQVSVLQLQATLGEIRRRDNPNETNTGETSWDSL